MTSTSLTQLALCPLCQQQLSLPADLDGQDLVRCPLCRREFTANKLVPVVPQLEIVRRERRQDELPSGGQHADAASYASDDASRSPAAAGTSEPARGQSAAGSGQTPPNAESTARIEFAPVLATAPAVEKAAVVRKRYFSHDRLSKTSAPVSGSKRGSRRRKKITSVELLKVVLGGLLAFPIAQVILWWGLGRDPLQLGKPVSRFVRYVVPPQFREPTGDVVEVVDEQPQADSVLNAKSPFDFGSGDN